MPGGSAAPGMSLEDFTRADTGKKPTKTPLREALIAERGALPGLTGATIGGTVGLLGGPASPITVPAGAIIGGMAPWLADLMTKGYNAASSPFGGSPVQMPSQAIEDWMTKHLGLPTAQDTTERMVQAGGGALGNVGSEIPAFANLAKAATHPVMQGIAESLASAPKTQAVMAPVSAAVGQDVAEQTDSPVLGTVASMATGLPLAAKSAVLAKTGIMSPDELRNAANSAYATAKDSGVIVHPDSFSKFVTTLRPALEEEGFDPGLHKNATAVLTRLENEAAVPPGSNNQTIGTLDKLRRVASAGVANAENGDQRRVAMHIVDHINDYVDHLTPNDLVSGVDPVPAAKALTSAKSLWQKTKKLDTIQEILDTAARQDTDKMNPNEFIKKEFQKINSNPKKFSKWNKDEQGFITDIASNGISGNLQKLSPHFGNHGEGLIPTVMALGLGHEIDPRIAIAAAPVVTAGIAAKMADAPLRNMRVSKLQSTIANGRELPSLMDRLTLQAPDTSDILRTLATGTRGSESQVPYKKGGRVQLDKSRALLRRATAPLPAY